MCWYALNYTYLRPLANTWFRSAQSLVPAWTSDNRWWTTACISRPLTVLRSCLHAPLSYAAGPTTRGTLGLGRLSCSQRNTGYKAEQVKIHKASAVPYPVPFLSPCAQSSLSRVDSDQAAGKRAGGVHYKKEKSRSTYTSHIPSGKPDGVALHYTCPTPEAVHWASQRGRPERWYVKEHVTPR